MKKDEATKSPQPAFKQPMVLAMIVILVVAAAWLASTAGVALVKGDGISQYEGIERTIAEGRLDIERGTTSDYLYVEEIRPTTAQEKQSYCKEVDSQSVNDPNSVYHYTVKISARSLFGWNAKAIYYDGCADLGVTVNGRRPE